jgi:hypothetical protein
METENKGADGKQVTLAINYGKTKPSRTVITPLIKGQTVLALLEAVAEVETYTVEPYILVTSIDGVKGTRGEMAWYYKIDGAYADQLASTKTLEGEAYIEWIYQTDTCSDSIYE